MKINFKGKFLLYLASKKAEHGFTLIELLVVVLIIGVLAAIALPNLLGQVAKGRQAEAKNNLGAINRAQQAYRLEEPRFAQAMTELPIKLSWQYYNSDFYQNNTTEINKKTRALYYAQAKEEYQDDILDYAGGAMQLTQGDFQQIICEEKALNAHNNQRPDFAQKSGDSLECVEVSPGT